MFFKHIKSNFKFQHIKEINEEERKKIYICELIIFLIAKYIKKYYMNKNNFIKENETHTFKINHNNLINGIYESLIYSMIEGTLTDEQLDNFCETYIKTIQNKKNRSFPRTSKTHKCKS